MESKKKEEITEVQIKESTFSVLKKYLRHEKCELCLGIFYLFGGSLTDFMAPMYIGWAIDYMSSECYSEITFMCI
jgi:hypothetical protein